LRSACSHSNGGDHWREGTNEPAQFSRFARLRIPDRPPRLERSEPWPEEWLLIEWPKGEKNRQSTGCRPCRRPSALFRLVDLAKLRWRIERDYQELKQELGLDTSRTGWARLSSPRHACIAAYGFLISERETIPPSTARYASLFPQPAVPDSYRPRGAAAAA